MRTRLRWIVGFWTLLSLVSCSALEGETRSVRLEGFEGVEVHQQTDVWCWAACAEMVLRYGGSEITQGEIADRIHGHGEDGPKVEAASRYEVYRALSPESPATAFEAIWVGLASQIEREVNERAADPASWKIEGDTDVDVDEETVLKQTLRHLKPSTEIPIEEMEGGAPAVAGLRDSPEDEMGHIYVIIGATYRERAKEGNWLTKVGDSAADKAGDLAQEHADVEEDQVGAATAMAGEAAPSKYIITSVLLVDPYLEDDPKTDANEMHVQLSFEAFDGRVDFVTSRSDAHEFLTSWSRLVEVDVE